jgi:hypothetical protein
VDAINDLPRMAGTVPASIPDNQPASLFSNFTIQDVDDGRPAAETVTVELGLPGGEGGAAFGSIRGGVTNFSGTPASVQAALRAVVFDPVPNRVPSGGSENVSIMVNLFDGDGNSPDSGPRFFSIVSSNDPPSAAVTITQASFPDDRDALPFRVAITDPDSFDGSYTLAIEPVSDPTFAFGRLDPASPSFTGSADSLAVLVQSVRFQPVPNKVTNTHPVTFRFRISDSQGAQTLVTATLTNRAVNDVPEILGVPGGDIRITDDTTNAYPFQTVRVEDVDENGAQWVTVTLAVDDPAKGTFASAGRPPKPPPSFALCASCLRGTAWPTTRRRRPC